MPIRTTITSTLRSTACTPRRCASSKSNRGWDIEAAHRAGVRIEHAQGWLPDANKRYRVRTDGKLERTDPDANTRPRKPSQLQLDAERRTGEPSHGPHGD